jgi:hypothetical protein
LFFFSFSFSFSLCSSRIDCGAIRASLLDDRVRPMTRQASLQHPMF